jgi:tRNA(fMet)-specific endonuclease VapC
VGIILDASVIISGEKGEFELEEWLGRQNDLVQLAAITVAEIWHGVLRAKAEYKERREMYVGKILTLLPVIPYTDRTALEHAKIWASLADAGKMTGYYDVIVAATALEHRSKVATLNPRHFSLIKGLELADLK